MPECWYCLKDRWEWTIYTTQTIKTISLRLALFDFDGTLSTADSMPAFLRQHLHANALVKALLRWGIACVNLLFIGKFSRDTAKAALLFECLKSFSPERLARAADEFAQVWLPAHLNPTTLAQLQMHLAQGNRVVVVSAAPDVWLKAICQKLEVECICTEMARDTEGRLLPMFKGPNCRGPEKVRRVAERFALETFTSIVAYGNSAGDRAMLHRADEAWFCKKNGQLIRLK